MEPVTVTLHGQVGQRPLRLAVRNGVHLLGRASGCDLRVDEPSVSRQHARLHVDGPDVHIEDMGSSNGTRVGGEIINRPTRLQAGAKLAVGNVVFRIEMTTDADDDVFLDQTMVRENLSVSLAEARRTSGAAGDRKADLFRLLTDAGELLARPGTPEDLFDPLLGLVEKTLAPERAVLLLTDPEHEHPQIVASRVPANDPGALIISRTLMGRVLSDEQAFLTEDASQDERLLGGDSLVGAGTRSAMAAPLFDNEAVIGILYADTADPGVRYDRDELTAFVLLANFVGMAITNARYRALEEERQRMATELDAARRIMARLLPAELPAVAGCDLVASFEPCEEVAGDLYDVRELPDGRLLILVGDVSGKGLPAALLVAAMLPAIRVVADDCGDLGRLASRVNDQLFAATDSVRFATLFLGCLDPRDGRLEYVNAGHNPPLLVTDGAVEELRAAGPPVGMLPGMVYTTQTATLAPDSRLVLYSDGLTEAQDADEAMYGDERLLAFVADGCTYAAADLQSRILDDVTRFVGDAPWTDDLTLMVVQRKRSDA